MKRLPWITALLLAGVAPAALAAPDNCERIKSDIQQRIINNGVPESGFMLNIVPNDQADKPDAEVVGHCANDTLKILYTRTSSGNYPGKRRRHPGPGTARAAVNTLPRSGGGIPFVLICINIISPLMGNTPTPLA